MVGLEGFEPPTHGLGNRCSILLSYRPIIPFSRLSPIELASQSPRQHLQQRFFLSKGVVSLYKINIVLTGLASLA